MNFSEQPPSKQWAALKFKGEKFAEVWFKPEGEPSALIFRIPQASFQIPGLVQGLTLEKLLKAVAIGPEDVESWRHGDITHSGLNDASAELTNPLPQPPEDAPHLDICVRLQPLSQPVDRDQSAEPDIALAKWQALEARWKAILGIEATIDTLRIGLEGLVAEMEGSLKRTLATEEKLYALAADMTQWNKAKSRIHYALPKPKEYIHRATWAKGAPERKRLEEIFKNASAANLPVREMGKVDEELEIVRKDRQILSAQGTAVYRECKGILAEVQGSLTRLQSNSAARGAKKKAASGAKRKSV